MPTLRRNNLAHRRLQAAKVIMVDILAASVDFWLITAYIRSRLTSEYNFLDGPGRSALEVSGHDDLCAFDDAPL
jgi:hypothetical protein